MAQVSLASNPFPISPRPDHEETPAGPAGTPVIDDSLTTLGDLYEYCHWIFNQLRPQVRGRVLEVGCGTGNITRFLSMCGTEVVGIDPVAGFVAQFNDRLGYIKHIRAQKCYLQELLKPTRPEQLFDSVVSCNVLEHIADDVAALALMARQLRPGGRVAIFVPAGPLIYGRLDRELGHYRRYSLRSLRRAFAAAGLEWTGGHYSNLLGFFGWGLNSVVLRRRFVPVRQAKVFDRLVPMLSALERMVRLPIGQSVVGFGRKPLVTAAALPLSLPTVSARAA